MIIARANDKNKQTAHDTAVNINLVGVAYYYLKR